jgi:hypothetical protein
MAPCADLAGIDEMIAAGEATEQYLKLRDEMINGQMPTDLPH